MPLQRGLELLLWNLCAEDTLSQQFPRISRAAWDSAAIKQSPVEWSLRYLWNYPEVTVVLSGMSDLSHVEDNVRLADKGMPNSLTADETQLISE